MEIKYLGHSSFLMKNKTATIVTDPYDSKMVGLKFPKIDSDIVTISHNHDDHNQFAQIGNNPLIINIPGEYEKNGIRVTGYKTFHDKKEGAERGINILYKIEVDGIVILHCGDLAHSLNDEILEEIDDVDVLMVPVGGEYSLSPQEASDLVKKIEPRYVIPMHYDHIAINKEVFPNLASSNDFIAKMGLSQLEPVDKLILKKEDVQEDGTKVILMQIS